MLKQPKLLKYRRKTKSRDINFMAFMHSSCFVQDNPEQLDNDPKSRLFGDSQLRPPVSCQCRGSIATTPGHHFGSHAVISRVAPCKRRNEKKSKSREKEWLPTLTSSTLAKKTISPSDDNDNNCFDKKVRENTAFIATFTETIFKLWELVQKPLSPNPECEQYLMKRCPDSSWPMR